MLNQSTLVLEGVTLAQVVELVVEVLVDLAGGTVADEQTTEDTHAAHPEDLAIERETHNISMDCSTFEFSTEALEVEGFEAQQICRIDKNSCVPGHTGVLGTLALTQTAVTTDAAGLVELTGAGAGVHGDGLLDDEAIADELADGLTGVGVGDLGHLIGVEPNLALAAADHGGREALLGAKVDPGLEEKKTGSASALKTLHPVSLFCHRRRRLHEVEIWIDVKHRCRSGYRRR